jgi:phage repressor protein C with HTH and peptisase S24 domain
MLPTLRPGQVVVFQRRQPKVGDIVMVSHDGLEKIKRIARQEHGRVYLLGDNPVNSTDSRNFGWLAEAEVRGVLYWPKRRPTVQ